MIPASDRTVTKTDNQYDQGPPLKHARELDGQLCGLAWDVLKGLCEALKEDPYEVASKRKSENSRNVRKVWFSAMRQHFEPDPTILEDIDRLKAELETIEEGTIDWLAIKAKLKVLREQARSKNWMLGAIAGGLDRGTVGDDQDDIDKACESNQCLYDYMDRVRDFVDMFILLRQEAEDLKYELAHELRAVREQTKRALANFKEAADLLERNAPKLRLVA